MCYESFIHMEKCKKSMLIWVQNFNTAFAIMSCVQLRKTDIRNCDEAIPSLSEKLIDPKVKVKSPMLKLKNKIR